MFNLYNTLPRIMFNYFIFSNLKNFLPGTQMTRPKSQLNFILSSFSGMNKKTACKGAGPPEMSLP